MLEELLQMKPNVITKTHVEATMPVLPDFYQPFGVLHGGATIALLEMAATVGALASTDLKTQRAFGVNVDIRHRQSVATGTLHGVANLDREEISEYSGGTKQFWNVAAYNDDGEVISEGSITTKILSLEYLEAKNNVCVFAGDPAPEIVALFDHLHDE